MRCIFIDRLVIIDNDSQSQVFGNYECPVSILITTKLFSTFIVFFINYYTKSLSENTRKFRFLLFFVSFAKTVPIWNFWAIFNSKTQVSEKKLKKLKIFEENLKLWKQTLPALFWSFLSLKNKTKLSSARTSVCLFLFLVRKIRWRCIDLSLYKVIFFKTFGWIPIKVSVDSLQPVEWNSTFRIWLFFFASDFFSAENATSIDFVDLETRFFSILQPWFYPDPRQLSVFDLLEGIYRKTAKSGYCLGRTR